MPIPNLPENLFMPVRLQGPGSTAFHAFAAVPIAQGRLALSLERRGVGSAYGNYRLFSRQEAARSCRSTRKRTGKTRI